MSTTTDVLSLFKYDPVADADSTFNITQALNNNWDKLDAAILLAIAAAGAYNPEESYAVGDYCTYKGKLRKCSTAIPTGEAWTEAHWTTTTVAAELAELSSQLSNRLRTPVEIPAYANLNDYTTAGMFYNPGTAQAVLNIPPNMLSGSFSLLVEPNGAYGNGCKQTITDNNQGITDTRVMSDVAPGHWSEWKTLATATPPQEFDLPLAEGLAGYAKYNKNQFGQVLITLQDIVFESGESFKIQNTLIGTLPEGFRPTRNIYTTAVATGDSGIPISGVFQLWERPDGNIYALLLQNTTPKMLRGILLFQAQG